ncbi:MAG: secondary thiamine-phosphate synthase enzyme YjbQ [Acidobacteria bacterium]|nr:secondary thiamine-phosphate synthase enzyme YjbQ [Acidobacteriota bacterium]
MSPTNQSAKEARRALSATLRVKTSRRTELLDITRDVQRAIRETGVQSGLCHLYVPHTTAGITINENADPDVPRDIEAAMDRLVPKDGPYKHYEGNADAHIKSTLTGVSLSVEIDGGELQLGRWQGIFFCEYDGPRQREVRVRVVRDDLS